LAWARLPSADEDETLTIRPHFCAVMYFCAALVIRNAPRRLTLITASHCSSVILNRLASRMIPALFTSTVGSPSSAATRSTAAFT